VAEEIGGPAWPRRHWRALLLGAVVAIAALGIGVAISWPYSSLVLVPDHSDLTQDVTVEGVAPARVRLEDTEESRRPGVYGLDWQAGHAIVGEVVARGDGGVTRTLRAVDGYLVPGMKVAIDSRVYRGDPEQALGIPFVAVGVRGELGTMPAWRAGPRSGPGRSSSTGSTATRGTDCGSCPSSAKPA